MAKITNRDILQYLDSRAPFSTAEEWDSVGLLIGGEDAPVSRILVALDVTPAVLAAAKATGAELIVTHHPVIFRPLPRLDSHSLPYQAAAAGISVISAHTNLDKAAGGVNDTLAARLQLQQVRTVGADGLCRIGTLAEAVPTAVFARHTAGALGTAVRMAGEGSVRTVAVCGGSGGDYIPALAGQADAFVTGEVRHHEWLLAAGLGLAVLEAGHYATEVPVVDTLCHWLRGAFAGLVIEPFNGGEPYKTLQA